MSGINAIFRTNQKQPAPKVGFVMLIQMNYLTAIILFFNILFCIPSIASLTKFDYWWVRGFDFPRVQWSVLIFANILLGVWIYDFDEPWHYVILALLCLSLAYQLIQIYPYTFLAPHQVIQYEGPPNDDSITLLVGNVLMNNSKYHLLIDLVNKIDPDILLTLETDKKWESALEPLEAEFKHTVKVPLDNLYGMHLYSKLPLEDIEVMYLVKEDIPSIHGRIVLPNGKRADIHCVHPRPPSPSESKTSTNRDAELLLVGREVDKDAELVLVLGDLNDVAWSRTTRLFQKISGLLDPRRGRGFFNTFNVEYPLLRWPLDHVFHSDDFTLIQLGRGENIGSDHFPMYATLNYTPRAQWKQKSLDSSNGAEQLAEDKIDKGDPKRTDV